MLIVDPSIYASILVKDENYEKARRFLEQHRKSELATIVTVFVEVAKGSHSRLS